MAKEKTTEEKVEMVQIPKAELDGILKGIHDLKADRDILMQVADKKQMAAFYQRNRGRIPSKVMLRVMDTRKDPSDPQSPIVEKVILGWRMTKDEVYEDSGTRRWVEIQTVKLIYDDGLMEEMPLRDYVRKYRQVEAEIRSKTAEEGTENLALKVVRLDNQKEYTIGIQYVN